MSSSSYIVVIYQIALYPTITIHAYASVYVTSLSLHLCHIIHALTRVKLSSQYVVMRVYFTLCYFTRTLIRISYIYDNKTLECCCFFFFEVIINISCS